MGKPESNTPGGQSVEQLLSSIRKAIEADGRLDAAPVSDAPPPGAAPVAPPVRPMAANAPSAAPRPQTPPATTPRVSVEAVVRPQLQPKAEPQQPPLQVAPAPAAASRDDEPTDERYHVRNPYRFRYSLEGSQTYMELRNRLSSLSSRARADTDRSMASLLGGDARREEARSRGRYQQPQPAATEQPLELRSSLPPEEAYVEDYAAGELVSGSVSYSPDYHEWSMEQSLDGYGIETAAPVVLPGTQQAPEQPVPDVAHVQPDAAHPVPDEAVEHAPQEYELEPAAEEAAEHEAQAPQGGQLQLEAMIRAVIEPELAEWFDEHLPDHVARAMPDEDAFIAMIRPLIEDWLSDNLAPIVEQAVKDEIARITGLKR